MLVAHLVQTSRAAKLAFGTEWQLDTSPVETDLAGGIDGDLVIGEAKSIGTFAEARQPGRLGALAARLDARAGLSLQQLSGAGLCWRSKRSGRTSSACPGTRIEVYVKLLDTSGPQRLE